MLRIKCDKQVIIIYKQCTICNLRTELVVATLKMSGLESTPGMLGFPENQSKDISVFEFMF